MDKIHSMVRDRTESLSLSQLRRFQGQFEYAWEGMPFSDLHDEFLQNNFDLGSKLDAQVNARGAAAVPIAVLAFQSKEVTSSG